MGGRLFQDIKPLPNFDDFKDAKFWMKHLMNAVGTGLWILLAVKIASNGMSSGWAWGLSGAIVSLAFQGNCFNTLSCFNDMMRGDTDIVSFLISMVFHCFGAIGANYIAEFIGFTADATPAHGMSFAGAFSADFYKFFFSSEFVGLFLFAVFTARSKSDMPSSLWSVLLVAVAFFVGGANFVFLPARLFGNCASFADPTAWAAFVCQLWATLFSAVVLEFAWTD